MNKINILVAEDEPLIRNSTVKKIARIGPPFFVAGEAEDGEEAIRMASDLYADIVITDIRMPEKNGLEVARHLKKTYPAIQIIIVTGYDDFVYAREAIRCEVTDFLVKPISREDLQTALERAKDQIELEFGYLKAHMERRAGRKKSASSLIKLMTRYISDQFEEGKDVSVSRLAKTFDYSPDHVTRLFAEILGVKPADYIRERKVRVSVRLLCEHPRIPINKISEQAGYRDPAHFSRVIKQITGMTPTEIRRKACTE